MAGSRKNAVRQNSVAGVKRTAAKSFVSRKTNIALSASTDGNPGGSIPIGIVPGQGSSAYVGASGRRSMMQWNPSAASADDDLLPALPTLRHRSQDLFRNGAPARGLINRITDNTVGTGLMLRATPDRDFLGLSPDEARSWTDATEREFRMWADSRECDFERQLTFGEMQHLAVKSQMLRGDAVVLLPWIERAGQLYDLRLQLIEADRVSNPDLKAAGDKIGENGHTVAGGIERDGNGVPVAVHISDKYPESALFDVARTWKRVAIYGEKTGRRNVLRLMEFDRIGQSRGEPALAPIVESMKQLTRYSEAEISAAVVNAILTVAVERPLEDTTSGMRPQYEQGAEPWNRSDNMQFGSGTWADLAPGEKLSIVAANRPSAQYDAFYTACMKQMGLALGVPFEVLMLHFQSSYSASRAAILEAGRKFKIKRGWLKNNFCQPVYEEFLFEAVLKNRIVAPGFLDDPAIRYAYSRAYWIGPTMGQVDPTKEVDAALKRATHFSSLGIETAELTGMDFEDAAYARAEERRLLSELGLPMPESGSASVTNQSDGGKDQPSSEDPGDKEAIKQDEAE